MTKDEVLSRYRHLRAISADHHKAAMTFLAPETVTDHAVNTGMMNPRRLRMMSSVRTVPADHIIGSPASRKRLSYTTPPIRSF